MIELVSAFGKVKIQDDLGYTFHSTDNVHQYQHEFALQGHDAPSSIHGVFVDNVPVAIWGASGGATGIHANSALVQGNRLYLAVGPFLACYFLDSNRLAWSVKVDEATCLGVYYHLAQHALIAHGELEISRINESGELLWQRCGADIFTGKLKLHEQFISVTDWNDTEYRFSYETGDVIFK